MPAYLPNPQKSIIFAVENTNQKRMDSVDFIREFPGEAGCKAKFKAFREQAGVACRLCELQK
jgi:hypothetical protein